MFRVVFFIFFWVVNVVSGCIDLIDCGLFLDGIATTSSLIELLGRICCFAVCFYGFQLYIVL